jgi:hypothetical protein
VPLQIQHLQFFLIWKIGPLKAIRVWGPFVKEAGKGQCPVSDLDILIVVLYLSESFEFNHSKFLIPNKYSLIA